MLMGQMINLRTDEFVKQSNKITKNIVSAVRINNQLTVNAINAAAENFRTLNQTIESLTEFNTNPANARNSFKTTMMTNAVNFFRD
jgi:predicted metal-binding transcription factor (methanogenesis marker protein 9)